MPNKTQHAPPRYKISDFFSSLIGDRVDGAHFEEQRRHEAHYDDGHGKSAGHTYAGQCQAVADEHAGERLVLGAERHANADFARALGRKWTVERSQEWGCARRERAMRPSPATCRTSRLRVLKGLVGRNRGACKQARHLDEEETARFASGWQWIYFSLRAAPLRGMKIVPGGSTLNFFE